MDSKDFMRPESAAEKKQREIESGVRATAQLLVYMALGGLLYLIWKHGVAGLIFGLILLAVASIA